MKRSRVTSQLEAMAVIATVVVACKFPRPDDVPDDGSTHDTGGAVDGSVVDAPLGPWSAPTLVPNVNTLGEDEMHASVSPDGLELYLVRVMAPSPARILASVRNANTENWPIPSALTVAPAHLHPEISPDGLELYTVTNSMLHRATRQTRSAAWGTSSPLFGGYSPSVVADGLALYYISYADGRAKVRRRSTPTGAWGPEASAGLHDAIWNHLTVNQSETYAVFSAPSDLGLPQVGSMERGSAASPWGQLNEVPNLSQMLTSGCELFSNLLMYCDIEIAGKFDVYQSTRSAQ